LPATGGRYPWSKSNKYMKITTSFVYCCWFLLRLLIAFVVMRECHLKNTFHQLLLNAMMSWLFVLCPHLNSFILPNILRSQILFRVADSFCNTVSNSGSLIQMFERPMESGISIGLYTSNKHWTMFYSCNFWSTWESVFVLRPHWELEKWLEGVQVRATALCHTPVQARNR
jgi:hypothetical protein